MCSEVSLQADLTMAQSTITNFYTNRKRSAVDDLKGNTTKIRALESDIISGYGRAKSDENPSQPSVRIEVEATVVISADAAASKVKPLIAASSQVTPKPKTPARSTRKTTKVKDPKQADMKMFLGKVAARGDVKSEPSPSMASSNVIKEEPVGEVSTKEKDSASEDVQLPDIKHEKCVEGSSSNISELETQANHQPIPAITVTAEDNTSSSIIQEPNVTRAERKESNVEKARKELSLGDIKSKLTRSARLAELKASMARIDEGRQKLKKIEETKKKQQEASNLSPQLIQFNAIELEVPVSPSKSPMKSPMKSPLKGLAGSRSPAFQRYASLAQPGSTSLPLPYSYRNLGDFFRCVDQTSSQMHNRGEVVTFEKLQSAVQNMTRKAFTLNHLAQILAVFPESYNLKYDKIRNFGVPSEQDKYHLVVSPVISSNPGGEKSAGPTITGSLLLERRRVFYNNLLDIVKKHHQEFLQSLDPPMEVPLGSLTRWHPDFAVDQVPSIAPGHLPEAPNLEKCVSAKDVLAKQRQLYSCNPRMEKALESVAQANSPAVPTVNVQVVNPTPTNPPTSPFKSMKLSSALKGIPKALLEKVRAREAAKALESMTRTSAQDKEAIQYGRLPEIARILRNVFVTEKKSTLPLDTVLEKVGNSYRSALSPRELEEHIRLMEKSVPGWLTFKRLLKNDYLELSKKAEMSRVMTKLQNLANAK
ncbi:hypothetical protein FOCC_FOCC014929 [Frankliniella occidentalis]|nr:hypothetical protein FOCC_FOCC014929 [Frankliniella occidentalis]